MVESFRHQRLARTFLVPLSFFQALRCADDVANVAHLVMVVMCS